MNWKHIDRWKNGGFNGALIADHIDNDGKNNNPETSYRHVLDAILLGIVRLIGLTSIGFLLEGNPIYIRRFA